MLQALEKETRKSRINEKVRTKREMFSMAPKRRRHVLDGILLINKRG